jgi:hypothetical protein
MDETIESTPSQLPDTPVVSNPLKRLVVPGVILLVLGGLFAGFVIPLSQNISQTIGFFRSLSKSHPGNPALQTQPVYQVPPYYVPQQVPQPSTPTVQPPQPWPLPRP